MGVFVGMGIAARLAEEGHEHQPPGVEAGEQRGDDQRPEGESAFGGIGALDDRVLREEAGKADVGQRDAHPRQRQRADHHRPEGQRDLAPEVAVIAHVLLMVHGGDHRARPEKQQRLEEGVRQQVEHGHRIDAHAGGHEHVTQLRAGGIGDHPLDVVLHQAHGRGEEGGGRADVDDEHLGLGGVFEQRRHAHHQEHPGGDHGGGVDQRRNRRRAFHGIRQPGVQEQLRRLAHGADEQQEGQQVGRVPIRPEEVDPGLGQHRAGGEYVVETDRIHHPEQAEDAQGEAEVPHPVDDEGLDRGGICRGLAVVEADQQVGGHAHTFPAEEHLQQVVGGDQHQHGKGEEREIGEEPGPVAFVFVEILVMGHVPHRVEVHEAGNRRHHDQHDRGQPVHADRPVGGQRAALDPAHDLDLLGGAGIEGQEDDPAEGRREEQQPRGDPLRGLVADQPPAEACDDRADQRGKEDDGFHFLTPSSR